MFSKSKLVIEKSKNDVFLEGIKSDMTNRAAITAKQESMINNLLLALEEERKELRSMRIAYKKKIENDDKRFERLMVLLEKRKQ